MRGDEREGEAMRGKGIEANPEDEGGETHGDHCQEKGAQWAVVPAALFLGYPPSLVVFTHHAAVPRVIWHMSGLYLRGHTPSDHCIRRRAHGWAKVGVGDPARIRPSRRTSSTAGSSG